MLRGVVASSLLTTVAVVGAAGKKGDASLDSFYPVLRHHQQMQQVETYAQARQPPIPAQTTLRWLLLGSWLPSLDGFRSPPLLSCCNVLLQQRVSALDCLA